MQIVGFYLLFGPLWLLAEISLSFIIINIIDNIINNKIPNNRKNLQVYKQTFAIDYKEYDLLKEYEDRYNFWSEFKKIEIFE